MIQRIRPQLEPFLHRPHRMFNIRLNLMVISLVLIIEEEEAEII